ncbi:radical SAM protein [Aliivibrio sp. S2MY1]|uniref:radical SAM protein n=1 Tax=Aliivibrio sp. S2MY1 TaxID=3028423 RepID=UPI002377D55A|nr:radical SAM protein [Aliivibrio sp. S2MY1]MDD9199150.1 hypothetical protein [Aliivibrio sp. S2MY1]
MLLKPETNVKAEILTRGVVFTQAALERSMKDNAKGQNMVYNAPLGGEVGRPQELFLQGHDGYITVVSCVSAHHFTSPVKVDVTTQGELACFIDDECMTNEVQVSFVPQPDYYFKKLANGDFVKKYISACGYDELNIIPWKGCFISKACKFCGVNIVATQNDTNSMHAFNLSRYESLWDESKEEYLANLSDSIEYALQSECYSEHMHVIIISGNLSDKMLDKQSDIYCDIVSHIKDQIKDKTTEGVIAVITPPKDDARLQKLKDAGVEIVVFNLEVGNEPWFSKYCPGKSHLGRDFFIDKLKQAVKVFGRGKAWTNFVLGLEPIEPLLELCDELASHGIVSSANVLHLDEGNRLDCKPPSKEDVVTFFYQLSEINKKYGFDAFYCSKALRTSLSNEMHDGRFILVTTV